ncbi:MAG: S9 family peptidase [bacterium]|nr:S9 family peptidase [bacterium]
MPNKRNITADDLYKFQLVADAQISPDGETVLFAVSHFHPNKKKNAYESHIWRVNTRGGTPQQFTTSSESESTPRWSPDGKQILFTSARDSEEAQKGKSQLWIIPATGGEAIRITDRKHGAGTPSWSPNGKTILFLGRVPVDPKEDNKPEEAKSDIVHIRRLSYRMNGGGYHYAYRTHLFTVSPKGGKIRQLTEGDWSVEQATWSADGKHILLTGNKSEDTDYTYARHLYSLPVKGGNIKKLCELPGHISSPTPSPDGKTIAFIGSDRRRSNGTNSNLYLVPTTGGKPQNISRHIDLSIGQSIGSDVRGGSPSFGPCWSPDGTQIKFLASDRGADRLFSLDLNTKELTAYTSGDYTVESTSYSADHSVAAYTRMTPTELAEVWIWTQGKSDKRLTRFNTSLLSRLKMAAPKRFTFNASDKTEVEGWIMLPPGSRRKKHPAILEIHGGPRAAFGQGFMHEFHLLNAAGFAVFYINPRGSSSYGEDWAFAVSKHYGERDYKDVTEAVGHVLRTEPIDPKNLGVTGGSYGGFMTNWIIGHSNRFKAACTQRCISNWTSFFGTSDIGWRFSQEEIGGLPWKNLKEYWKRSPIAYVEQIQTPLLIIHSEEDWRCPIEQAEQLYTALKWLKQDVEFIRFPGESHELSRSGKPKHRIERLKAITGWFEEKILGKKRN